MEMPLLGMTSKPSAVSPTSITNGGAGSTWHLPDFSYTSAALRLSKWQPAKMSERLDFVLVQRAGQMQYGPRPQGQAESGCFAR